MNKIFDFDAIRAFVELSHGLDPQGRTQPPEPSMRAQLDENAQAIVKWLNAREHVGGRNSRIREEQS